MLDMDIKIEQTKWQKRKKYVAFIAGGIILSALLLWMALGRFSSTLRVKERDLSVATVEEGKFDDYIYIDDLAEAYRLIGEKGKPFHDYVIGSSNAKPLKQYLLEMQAAIAPDLEFKFGNIPCSGINLPLSKFDCSITERDTGFKAKTSYTEGCIHTMEWLKTIDTGE